MERYYNAFISYRHHPEDIRVATEIQRLLERFRVPKSLKKQSKGITRLFRDKDELPITSNLSDDITAALRHSEFLIVICSIHTRESLWVQREIETFLQTHSRDKVLTVLVNGEPYDVIPEILLYDQSTDPETGEVSRIPLEPLSCDWRMSRRQAKREELPRLAAALLHCNYDELRQRQKQYRLQRLVMGISAALVFSLCLTAYFLYTSLTIRNANIQIQENLTQALKNQSSYLATAAQEHLDKGDRLTALTLLLEALPSEDNVRPYVATAEKVLADALGVYGSHQKMAARGAIIPSNSGIIGDFRLTDDEKWIYVRDARNLITVWDLQTLLQHAVITPVSGYAALMNVTPQGNLLVDADDTLYCYTHSGTLLWQLAGCHDTALLQEEELLLVITESEEHDRYLQFVNMQTGNAVRDPLLLSKYEEDNGYPTAFLQDEFLPGNPLLLDYHENYDYTVYAINPDTAEKQALFSRDSLETSLMNTCTTSDGKILFLLSSWGFFNLSNSAKSDVLFSYPSTNRILCLDAQSFQTLWTYENTTYMESDFHTIHEVPETDYIFCQIGNTLQLINKENGTLVQQCDTISPVIQIFSYGADTISGVLNNGYVFHYQLADNLCGAVNYGLEYDLYKACRSNSMYTLAYSQNKITVYDYVKPQYQWTDEINQTLYLSNFLAADNLLAFYSDDFVYLYDLQEHSLRWCVPSNASDLLCFSDDHATLWVQRPYSYSFLHALDTATGSMTEYEIPRYLDDQYLSIRGELRYCNGAFWYFVSYDQNLSLVSWVPETGDTHFLPILVPGQECPSYLSGIADSMYGMEYLLETADLTPEERKTIELFRDSLEDFQAQTENARLLTVTQEAAWIIIGTGDLYAVSLENAEKKLLAQGFTHTPAFAVRQSDGCMAVSQKDKVMLFTPSGDFVQSYSIPEGEAGSLYFRNEELFALCHSGFVFRFGADGTCLSSVSNLTFANTVASGLLSEFRDPMDVTWHFTQDNKLILFTFFLANIIDCDTWESCGVISNNCFMYHEPSDCFLIGDTGEISAYPRYTLSTLLEMAQEQLGPFQLSQDTQNAYGIG